MQRVYCNTWTALRRIFALPNCTTKNASNCIFRDSHCQYPDYSDFDEVAKKEILNPYTVDDIVNESSYCQSPPASKMLQVGDLKLSLFLRPLKGKIGIYHLWTLFHRCECDNTYIMKCEYVGKGTPNTRVSTNVKKKWPGNEDLFVSFHECENRLAKYYEQLFLDTYNFSLNKMENSGKKTLYGVWENERFIIGTDLEYITSCSKMESPDDW